jgi:thiol-disulfide isomerase/thioredoxin
MRLIARFLLLAALLTFAPRQGMAAEPGYALLPAGGAGGWLNVTRPLNDDDMKGRLVLLDFWTYGCINCIQIVPDLEYLENKYGEKLLVVGVHSAKFDGEKGNERIEAAARRFGLKHPVINDSDFAIWNAFGVRAWPTQILLDAHGKEIARYSGEGHRAEIDAAIQKSLKDLPAPHDIMTDLVAAMDHDSTLLFPGHMAAADKTPWGPVIFVADAGHHRVLAIADDGTVKAVIGSGKRGEADGKFAAAQFDNPRGVAVAGNILYIADTGNHMLRQADLTTGMVKTLAGTGKRGVDRTIKSEPGLKTSLASPWDVELIDDGKRVAIAMAGLHQLWAYDIAAGTVSVIAGTGAERIDDGPALRSTLSQPSGLSLYNGDLYFVDAESSALRVMDAGGNVRTLIGTGLFDFGHVDGTYPLAMMQHPQGLAASDGRIVIADTYNDALRVYYTATKKLGTVTLPPGTLSEPGDVILRGDTAIVSDTNHHTLKKIDIKTGSVTEINISAVP